LVAVVQEDLETEEHLLLVLPLLLQHLQVLFLQRALMVTTHFLQEAELLIQEQVRVELALLEMAEAQDLPEQVVLVQRIQALLLHKNLAEAEAEAGQVNRLAQEQMAEAQVFLH
jgi:hypothetical protein